MSARIPLGPIKPSGLRVAVLHRVFAPTGGGAERYAMALVEAMAERHEVHVFAQVIEHQHPGVTYHRISCPMKKPRWINQLWYAWATARATREGFDVVHSHENTWHGDVQTVHVLPVWHTLFAGRAGLRRLLRWLQVATSPRLWVYLGLEARRMAADGRAVVATSPSLRDILGRTFPQLGRDLPVLTPGVHMPRPQQIDGAARQVARLALQLPAAGRCVLLVGNDHQKKGLPTLLAALSSLPDDVYVAVAGQGHQRADMAELARALEVSERVHFLGPQNDMVRVYAAADVLAHPTLEDTFAMVVLEAMAHGRPVVVSGVAHCGISGLLEDGRQALLLDDPTNAQALARALNRVFAEPELRDRLVQEGRRFAVAHSWAEIAAGYDRLYRAQAARRQAS